MSVLHDLNNILFVLSGGLELIEAEPVDRTRDIAVAMRTALDKAASMTRPLLACAHRAHRLEPEWVNVQFAITSMHPVLSRLAGDAIAVTCRLTAGEALVEIGPSLFDRVLMNLVANARDAMPDGGRIEIVTRPLTSPIAPLLAFPRRGMVAIEVIDTGLDMTAETRVRMFDAFCTTKNEQQGTGLGMSTVQEIIEAAGGSIEVISPAGKGTTVRLILPAV